MGVAQLYETSILELQSGAPSLAERGRVQVRGLHVIASPPQGLPGTRVEEGRYLAMLEEADAAYALDDEYLYRALALLAYPETTWEAREGLLTGGLDDVAAQLANRLMREPVVPSEASPFEKRSLADIASLASMGGLYLFGTVPIIGFVGALGLVAVRQFFGGPVWEGVRPKIVDFSGDVAEFYLDQLRERLGIPGRSRTKGRR